MKRASLAVSVVSVFLIIECLPGIALALPLGEPITAVADRLVAVQQTAGTWVGEEDFTGSIVAGLVRAYEQTGDVAYITAAELGASYILDAAGGNFFGDEAYALARLTEATGEPAYADIVLEFYNGLDTYTYIAGFIETDHSNAVFYVAHHAVAAHKVGATDALIWREALTYFLSQIADDLAYYPVMSLGVATWALAQTGDMDDTRIDPDGLGEDDWADTKLSDLPSLLAGHQVPFDRWYAGSFYHRFDHTLAGPGYEAGGYTEDTIFGVLGLIAADNVVVADGETVAAEDAGWDFGQEIQSARQALAAGVSAGGVVYNHIWVHIPMEMLYCYAGEMLETIPAVETLAVLE